MYSCVRWCPPVIFLLNSAQLGLISLQSDLVMNQAESVPKPISLPKSESTNIPLQVYCSSCTVTDRTQPSRRRSWLGSRQSFVSWRQSPHAKFLFAAKFVVAAVAEYLLAYQPTYLSLRWATATAHSSSSSSSSSFPSQSSSAPP